MKRYRIYIEISVAMIIAIIAGCYTVVVCKASNRTFDNAAEVPHNKVGLLLGTSPITRSGIHNLYFDNRIKAAEELYKSGKIDYILASGGSYTGEHRYGCDELQAMKDSLLGRGIPEDRIILDYEGRRTLNSIVKAKEFYKLDSVTLISQKYHNERALYLADKNGLNAVAYNAEPSPFLQNKIKNTFREIFARPKMFLDIMSGVRPTFNDETNPFEVTVKPAQDLGAKKDLVEIQDTDGLRIYFPNYSKIDLVCGEMPSKENTSVLMFAEAAFTGKCLDEFKHINIAVDHVSGGKREAGYACKRNSGAFVYYDNTPQFLYKNYSKELTEAAKHGGCGFAQEMMIHNGKIVPHTRPDGNTNEFRALCLIDGRVAIADSRGPVKFGEFNQNLLDAGATEALYLDMGPGWNYSWYRDSNGKPVEIHSLPTSYATNWITFYN